MDLAIKTSPRLAAIKRFMVLMLICWTMVVGASLIWNLVEERFHTLEIAKKEALVTFNKDQAFRFWATKHGGVYVPATEETPPNPYLSLSHVPDRDITLPSGKKLTLMNPAYALRQLMNDFEQEYGIKGHITSLNPMNPANAPDEWERTALQKFERGVAEVSETIAIDGKPYLRLIRPMLVKKGCLKCHAWQGYKEGDIRGGVGISLPLDAFLIIERDAIKILLATHGGIWLLGLGGIGFVYSRSRKNIIERTRAEEAARESRERFSHLVEATSDFVWEVDADHVCTYASPRIKDILGYESGELVGKSAFDLMPPDEAGRLVPALKAATAARKPFSFFENVNVHKDGHRVILEDSGVPFFDVSGTFLGYRGMSRDVTERRHAEQLLALLNFALNSVHEEAYLIDEGSFFQYVNDESCRALKYSRDELLGMGVAQVDPDFPRERWPDHWQELKAQGSLMFEGRHQARGGRIFPVEIHANYFEYGGRSYNLALVRDITERKRIEAALRASEQNLALHVMQTPLGVIEWNLDFEVTKWNPAAERIFGYSRSEALGTHASLIVPPSAKGLVDQVWSALIQHKGGLRSTNENTTKDRRLIYCEWYNTPLVDANGNVIAVASLVQDITERKQAEEEIRKLNEGLEKRVAERTADLQRKSEELKDSQMALMNIVKDLNEKTAELEQANTKLQELDRLKSMFIASMSHELRTPLNSIIGFSSILLNEWAGPLTAEQKENLDAVLRSGKHLLSLINDVIDVSKIESGKVESIVEDFDVRDVVMEAVETLKKDIEKKGLELKVHAHRQVMHADRRRLLQCLLNLVSNAVKFTKQGSINVSAEISADGSMMTMAVEDTGIGIREDELGSLFSPFVRLNPPAGSMVPGTGLGLYLTKKLVQEILKGDVFVTSTYGAGSRFTLQLPVAG